MVLSDFKLEFSTIDSTNKPPNQTTGKKWSSKSICQNSVQWMADWMPTCLFDFSRIWAFRTVVSFRSNSLSERYLLFLQFENCCYLPIIVCCAFVRCDFVAFPSADVPPSKTCAFHSFVLKTASELIEQRREKTTSTFFIAHLDIEHSGNVFRYG